MSTKHQEKLSVDIEVDRIEALYRAVTGRDVTPMRRTHKDRDQLRLEQLRTIADWLEHMQPIPFAESATDTRLESALALIESGNWTKADMVDALTGGEDGNPNV